MKQERLVSQNRKKATGDHGPNMGITPKQTRSTTARASLELKPTRYRY